jgi:hypothetical protein
MPFYSKVQNFTAKYAAGMGLGGSYGHAFRPPKIQELLKFDMILLVRDGVYGGSKGAIHLRWDRKDGVYREEIAESMRHMRFLPPA